MSRPIEDIEVDLREVGREIQSLQLREVKLKKERDERRIEDAQATPHPWLGKRVKFVTTKRIDPTSWRYHGLKEVTYRGTVIIKTIEHKRVTGLGYDRIGDPVVISNTGKKGWSLHAGWQLDEGEQA
jgi:hypothetical protein